MAPRRFLPLAGLLLLAMPWIAAQERGPLFEEPLTASDPVRSAQVRELDAYIRSLKGDQTRLSRIFKPDYRSVKAFRRSQVPLREAFAASIGYPPPGKPQGEATFTRLGEDSLGIYYRATLPVLPGVNAVGLYLTPRGAKGRVPLVISMHGGGGSPEIATYRGGSNYHDMVRGGLRRGYAVWAPTHLFRAEGYPQDIRQQTDQRLRLVGTTLMAVEAAKITRSLDVLLQRPEIDPKRVAMVGLSYGGFYALITPALDERIQTVVSSCYFGVQEYRYEKDEASVPGDFRTPVRFSLFTDDVVAALICPRPLEIQAGKTDQPTHREKGRELAPKVADYYARLNQSSRFRFVVFEGGHEFWDTTAWEWVSRHL